MYTYWRIGPYGPIRTPSPNWDFARVRVAGWRCLITSVAGGRILLVIDRNARRYYRVHQSTRNITTEIDRETARALYTGAKSRRLIPVLD